MYFITSNSKIYSEIQETSVILAIKSLRRDMGKVLCESELPGVDIRLEQSKLEQDNFMIEQKENNIYLYAASKLGFVFGIYEISCQLLGIKPFWFWMDQRINHTEKVMVPEDYHYTSHPYKVKWRGWFINDEVLLDQWSVERDIKKPWEMVFETLLRCGGNLVIPGTDINSKKYRKMASDMGLAITHHHAEPLGAEMFARKHPEQEASYSANGDLFRKLWREGIEEQRKMDVVWNLGFRGQGDRPFWLDDPRYQTELSRGKLMGDLIREQYKLVKEYNPDAICCSNLYGETMELYQKGFLQLPEDVIHIWADNGYGKMVSRRQENHNPRIQALPLEGARGHHGIYYHASFYDLQAANHITMQPNSISFVQNELSEVLRRGANDYWIINASNIKPHVFYLDFISKLWQSGAVEEQEWLDHFVNEYYGTVEKEGIKKCYHDFASYAVAYGKHEDEHAGEQFVNHVPRMLMTQFIKNPQKQSEELLWASGDIGFEEQVAWFKAICRKACEDYNIYLVQCEKVTVTLPESSRILFEDSLLLQVRILYYCYRASLYTCKSIECGFEKDFQKAFYYAGKAKESFEKGNCCMREREHGKWQGFYKNECLADIKQSAWMSEIFMGVMRTLGDGPHFWEWQREFLHSEENKRVTLVLNMENHLPNNDMYNLMKERWVDEEI